jgi:thiol-disulfide isomerase/thioredoxin
MRIASLAVSLLVAAAVVFAAAASQAAGRAPFTSKAFAAAEAEGRPILVDVAAGWCPICKAQEPIVDKLATDPKFAQLVIFRLDYDSQKADWRKFGVHMQSTLIAFHGGRETGRSVGDTHADSLARLLDSTLN